MLGPELLLPPLLLLLLLLLLLPLPLLPPPLVLGWEALCCAGEWPSAAGEPGSEVEGEAGAPPQLIATSSACEQVLVVVALGHKSNEDSDPEHPKALVHMSPVPGPYPDTTLPFAPMPSWRQATEAEASENPPPALLQTVAQPHW